MAKGFGKRLARATALIGGGIGQGWAAGTMKSTDVAREEYHQRLRDERQAAMAAEERTWREGESEKGREFEREQFQTRMDWEKEKHGLEREDAEHRFDLQMKLKQAGGGKGGGSAGITRTVTDAEGNVWGITRTGEKIDLGIKGKVSSGKDGSGDTIARTVTDADGNMWGITRTGEKIDLGIKGRTTGAGGSEEKRISEFMSGVAKRREKLDDLMNVEMVGKSSEEKDAIATQQEAAQWTKFGKELPKAVQESVAEVPQPAVQNAPATSTQGEAPTDATPTGQGTEASPYVVESEAHKAWVLENAPPGAYVAYGGKVIRKK